MNKKKYKKLSEEELKKRKLKEKKFALIFIIAVMTFYAVLIIIIMIQRSSPDYVPPKNVSSYNGSGRLLFFVAFRIFCFIEPTDKPNTDLYVNMQKIHLKKLKSRQSKNRCKFIPFITLDEATQS